MLSEILEMLRGDFVPSRFIMLLVSYAAVVFLTLPLHEWAHAFVATKLGDPTPRWHGRLSLNPMKHLDMIGTAMLVLFGFGFAKPVPVNPRYFKNPRAGMALVALAGPVSNLLLATVSMGLCRLMFEFMTPNQTVITILYYAAEIFLMIAIVNISLAVFNLLPIPPLDGYRVASLFLPSRWTYWMDANQQLLSYGVLLLLATGQLSGPLTDVNDAVRGALMNLFGLV